MTELVGGEFQELLESYGIEAVSTTVRNPKSNEVVKRVHCIHRWRVSRVVGKSWYESCVYHSQKSKR
jgi:hypothetical protein